MIRALHSNDATASAMIRNESKTTAVRFLWIDFIKGILVLLMVIYHSLNYLQYGSLPHDYMAFVPPSFIMITGFMVTFYYISKYKKNYGAVGKRLGIRAMKLFMLFTFLNICVLMVKAENLDKINIALQYFVNSWKKIYLFSDGKVAAFQILLPISYLLALSIIILKLQSIKTYFVHLWSVIFIAFCVVLDNNSCSIYNLNMISSGFVGMSLGEQSFESINQLGQSWTVHACLLILFLICLVFFGDIYFVQLFATVITLIILYVVSIKIPLEHWLSRQVILLGQYSLLSYLVQILYLQLFKINLFNWIIDEVRTIMLIIVIMLMMWVTIRAVNYAQSKINFVRVLYKFIFS